MLRTAGTDSQMVLRWSSYPILTQAAGFVTGQSSREHLQKMTYFILEVLRISQSVKDFLTENLAKPPSQPMHHDSRGAFGC